MGAANRLFGRMVGFDEVAVYRGPGGFLLTNRAILEVEVVNRAETQLQAKHTVSVVEMSCMVPSRDAAPPALGSSVRRIIDFDDSHAGAIVERGHAPEFDTWCDTVNQGSNRWSHSRECIISRSTLRPGFLRMTISIPSLRGGDGYDVTVPEDAMTVYVPDDTDSTGLGGALLDVFDKADAWCAVNGRNPRTGMPVAFNTNLGIAGVVTFKPPAYFEEDFKRDTGVLRRYFRVPDYTYSLADGWREKIVAQITLSRVAPGRDASAIFHDSWRQVHGDPVVNDEQVPSDGGKCGCFTEFGTISNKSWETWWYRAPLADGSVLELRLDLRQPGRRKQMAGKARRTFERCAKDTRIAPSAD